MPLKDLEKRREYDRQWKRKNVDPEKRREYYRQWIKNNLEYDRKYSKEYRKKNDKKIKEKQKQWYKNKHPNCKSHNSYYDYETHRELAINSGINEVREWHECFKMGLVPDGIYRCPDQKFKKKYR